MSNLITTLISMRKRNTLLVTKVDLAKEMMWPNEERESSAAMKVLITASLLDLKTNNKEDNMSKHKTIRS